MEIHTARSLTPLPVFKLKGDSLQSNYLTGSGPWVHLKKFPTMLQCLDTGYTWLFLKETGQLAYPNHIPVIVGNSNNLFPVTVFVDLNLNLDFTDDGPPVLLKLRSEAIPIEVKIPTDSTLRTTFFLNRFNWGADATNYRLMMHDYFKTQYPDRIFLGVDACIREQKLNCKYATIFSPFDTFSLAIFDANGNGKYNDVGKDMIIFSQLDSIPNKDGGASPVAVLEKNKNDYILKWKGLNYTVGFPNISGDEIDITFPKDTARNELLYSVGDRFPKFRFRDPLNDRKWIKLTQFRFKKVYIYIWDINSSTFANDTVDLRLLTEKYGRKLKIISLHNGDHPERLKNAISFRRLPWIHGYATSHLLKKLGVNKNRTGFYLGRFRKIKAVPISPIELLNRGL